MYKIKKFHAVKVKLQILLMSLLLCFLIPIAVNAQILRDTSSLNLVKKSIGNIYNQRFNEYAGGLEALRRSYPGSPVVNLLDGMKIYWENYPLLSSSPTGTDFEKQLRECIRICETRNDTSDEAEFLLANLSARGFLLLFYLDNDLTMSVIPLATSTYRYIRRSYDYTSVYPDFMFFTGLYDYTREAYPENFPGYKPIAMLFPRGDKAKGLMELQNAARNSIFLKAEASVFLTGIYLSFENNYEKAYIYSRSLHELYPANPEFLGFHIRNLLLTKRYDEAEKLIESSAGKNKNPYFQAQVSILRGVLQEKKYYNDILAEQLYLKGIEAIAPFGHYGNEFAAYGYFGLSRISGRKSDSDLNRTYRKKAEELADFKYINFD